jgi:hypothetical protein
MRKNTKRGITAVALLGAVLATSTGCSRAAPSADVITLIYDKGPFSKTAFQECVEPNHTAWAGPFDQTFSYTAGQITYDFTGAKDAESAPLKFVSQDNQEMEVTGVAAFDLNTDCKTLQNFHENIGRRKNMYNDGDKVGEGWVPGLQTYTGQPLQRALQDAGQKYGWEALRGDGATREGGGRGSDRHHQRAEGRAGRRDRADRAAGGRARSGRIHPVPQPDRV